MRQPPTRDLRIPARPLNDDESRVSFHRFAPARAGVLKSNDPRDYHGIVESVAGTLLGKVHNYGSVAVSLATLIALSAHPTPWCIDCEFPIPWGHVSDRIDDILGAWLLVAPFIAGLFAFKKGWLVPASMVLATLITQPLGGVPWWSLRENEGPIIVILGVPACAVCLLLGYWVRGIALLARRNLQQKTQT